MPISKSHLPDKRSFETQFARRLVVAVSLVREALQAKPEWRASVTHKDHAEKIARALLSSRPALVGEISLAIDQDEINTAATIATTALTELFAIDPYLLSASVCTRPEALAWLRAQHPHRDADELAGQVQRADAATLWTMKYDAQHALNVENKNVDQIAARIAAMPLIASNVI